MSVGFTPLVKVSLFNNPHLINLSMIVSVNSFSMCCSYAFSCPTLYYNTAKKVKPPRHHWHSHWCWAYIGNALRLSKLIGAGVEAIGLRGWLDGSRLIDSFRTKKRDGYLSWNWSGTTIREESGNQDIRISGYQEISSHLSLTACAPCWEASIEKVAPLNSADWTRPQPHDCSYSIKPSCTGPSR